ncbi:adenylyl-sulfate kinase [Oscillatoria amoena NRMC-F 0135]|nr:adenylyl-sulfate kinase [Geitlerinema splendidum]MDL5051678.1 adenylyl-sulfate kinase [Oscillatoria amoena NRMC-F 0135]
MRDSQRLREESMHQQGVTLWFTGLSGAGKTTLCQAVAEVLRSQGYQLEVLDGDTVRQNLCKDLGFSKADRDENIRRIGWLSQLLTRNGAIVLVSAISPYREIRNEVRQSIEQFIEIYVNAPLEVCESRDVKGLYQKARAGIIKDFTGIDDPYEPPLNPDVECQTHLESISHCVVKILNKLNDFLPLQSTIHNNAKVGN